MERDYTAAMGQGRQGGAFEKGRGGARKAATRGSTSLQAAGSELASTKKTWKASMAGTMDMGFDYSRGDTLDDSRHPDGDDDAQARAEARRIGPFCFDVDNDIETEVLVNEQVQDDLNALKDILDQGKDNVQTTVRHMGKSKKRRH